MHLRSNLSESCGFWRERGFGRSADGSKQHRPELLAQSAGITKGKRFVDMSTVDEDILQSGEGDLHGAHVLVCVLEECVKEIVCT